MTHHPTKRIIFSRFLLSVPVLAVATLACSNDILGLFEPNYLLIEKAEECIGINEASQETGEFEKTSEEEIIQRCLQGYRPEQIAFLCRQAERFEGRCPDGSIDIENSANSEEAVDEDAVEIEQTATSNPSVELPDPNPPPTDCENGSTDAECNNAGVHRYVLSVEEFGSCVGTGAKEREEEFILTFSAGFVALESIDFGWIQDFQQESENTYIRGNQTESVQRLTFTTDGFVVETRQGDSACFLYTRTLLD